MRLSLPPRNVQYHILPVSRSQDTQGTQKLHSLFLHQQCQNTKKFLAFTWQRSALIKPPHNGAVHLHKNPAVLAYR